MLKDDNSAVIETGAFGLRFFMSKRALRDLPQTGAEIKLYTHFHVRENAFELYGFPSLKEMRFFELLISVSGVGPKSALSILEVAELPSLLAAIKEGRPDLLSQASGVGRKTAERVIIELRNKINFSGSEEEVKKMESDAELVDVLFGLGYRREEAKRALEKITKETIGFENRLKEALRALGGERHK